MLIRNLSIVAIFAAASVPAVAQTSAAQAPQSMTKADMAKNVDARFAIIDGNKDGFLSKDEIAAVQAKVVQQAVSARQARLEEDFKKLDTDKNGSLSVAEFKAAAGSVKASETPDQVIAAMDTNKDGKIAAAEYRVPPLADFDKLDANHDGTLTAQEASAGR